MRVRSSLFVAAIAVAIGAAAPAQAETVVRYGISMADVPLTTGQPDRGVNRPGLSVSPRMPKFRI